MSIPSRFSQGMEWYRGETKSMKSEVGVWLTFHVVDQFMFVEDSKIIKFNKPWRRKKRRELIWVDNAANVGKQFNPAFGFPRHSASSDSPHGLNFTWWDVTVYVPDINHPSLPTPFFLFLSLFLSLWPLQLYFMPQILPTTLCFLTLFFKSYFFFSTIISLYKSLPQPWYNPL